jgi:hypothetical protein
VVFSGFCLQLCYFCLFEFSTCTIKQRAEWLEGFRPFTAFLLRFSFGTKLELKISGAAVEANVFGDS